jgi:Skp family chaperone for outer membrane proteins
MSPHQWRVLFLLLASARVYTCAAQDSQSLGDAARQARLQKQQKDAKAKDAPASSKDSQPPKPPKKIVTNEDIPEHVGSTLTSAHTPRTPAYVPPSYGPKPAIADQLKSMIQAQKAGIVSLQRNIDNLTQSLEHPETCLTDCAQKNESQRAKAMQLEAIKVQLDQQQKRLEELQDLIRKKGYGSSVYDP